MGGSRARGIGWLRGLALAALVVTAPAADPLDVVAEPKPPPVAAPLPAGWSAPPPGDAEVSPGREVPTTSPPEGVLLMSWGGDYHSVLVIGPGSGTVRPAWVLTYHDEN